MQTPLHCTLLCASAALSAKATMHALRGITLARLATFIAAQPLFSVADALAELRRRQADGKSASKFVGVFEGFVACNEAPPLLVRGRACAKCLIAQWPRKDSASDLHTSLAATVAAGDRT